jgi:GT2 family glycosyltransferase
MDKITFCIPSKTNLRYLKTCIPSIRKNAYRDDHEIIIFVDQDEDGTIEWLDSIKDEYNVSYYVNPDLGNSLYGIGRAYDYCIEKSTTDIFMIFHADMMLGKHADLKAFNHLKEKTVVCSTRIEPPIHPNGGEKILEDFGMWPEEFKEAEFDQYVNEHLEDDKTTDGIFAPWMMHKSEFLNILGGHDPIMHSCREDSDLFNRMHLAGFTFIQPWNSLVYHLTGRGAGSFDGDPERHAKWKADMNKSTLEFIRKWGSNVNHTPLMKPLVSPRFDIGYVIENCEPKYISTFEPWCDKMYIDCNYSEYVNNTQPNTATNLSTKFYPISHPKVNSVTVGINMETFNKHDYHYLQVLHEVIHEANDTGVFELGNLKVSINNLETFENDLIFIENSHNEKN